MFNEKLKTLIQYIVPQHALSQLMGKIANSRWRWIKNTMIKTFANHYQVDMSEAIEPNLENYQTFNLFFTRHLRPETRPIVGGGYEIACPVDGFVSEIGYLNKNQLLQAKGSYYTLQQLLADSSELAHAFYDGCFATLYLAPKNYHRVHMPFAGNLQETIYVPGKLFSVSPTTVRHIPHLFARNERLITYFTTAAGPMAVIFVGAMIVGSIETAWTGLITQRKKINRATYQESQIKLDRGAELGAFQMGSTAIVLFSKGRITWNPQLVPGAEIKMGQLLGQMVNT